MVDSPTLRTRRQVAARRPRLASCAALMLWASLCAFAASSATAQPIPVPSRPPSAESLLRAHDANNNLGQRTAKMTVQIELMHESPAVIDMEMQARSNGDVFVEVLSPDEMQGNRYLKLGEDLWMFTKSSGEIARLSGPQLDMPFLGTDFGFRDIFGFDGLEERYHVRFLGAEKIGELDHWVIDLTIKDVGAEYGKIRLWFDKKDKLLRKAAVSTLTDKLIKTIEFGDYVAIAAGKADEADEAGERTVRHVASTLVANDLRSPNGTTTIHWLDVKPGADIMQKSFDKMNISTP